MLRQEYLHKAAMLHDCQATSKLLVKTQIEPLMQLSWLFHLALSYQSSSQSLSSNIHVHAPNTWKLEGPLVVIESGSS